MAELTYEFLNSIYHFGKRFPLRVVADKRTGNVEFWRRTDKSPMFLMVQRSSYREGDIIELHLDMDDHPFVRKDVDPEKRYQVEAWFEANGPGDAHLKLDVETWREVPADA